MTQSDTDVTDGTGLIKIVPGLGPIRMVKKSHPKIERTTSQNIRWNE